MTHGKYPAVFFVLLRCFWFQAKLPDSETGLKLNFQSDEPLSVSREKSDMFHPRIWAFDPLHFLGARSVKNIFFPTIGRQMYFSTQDDFVSIFEYGASGAIIYSFL